MNVLVTGGAGYIGSHTAKLFAQAGSKPVVLDNLSRGRRHNVRWGPLVEADLANQAAIEEALRCYQIDVVVHFAAFAYVGESMQSAGLYFQNNTANSIYLLNAMRNCGVRKIVFSSTCATYGMPEGVPIGETHSQKPVNPYGESKLMVETVLRWLGETEDLQWIALRYFNACGADPDGELGEEHEPETHLIPLAIQSVLGGSPLCVYGSDYLTPDGTAIRDYIHVTDLADAHLRAVEALSRNVSKQALNLGTGQGASVLEIIHMVESISGRKVPYVLSPRRAGDPAILVADPSLANSVLGWSPRYSSLQSIIETAWKWHSSRKQPA